MSDLNSCTFTGRLGKDAESKTVGAKGTVSTEFSIACTTGFGQYEKTSWIDVQVWGQKGTAILEYLKKGTRVGVTGEFAQNNWVDNNGVKHTQWRLTANSVILLGKPKDKAQAQAQSAPDYGNPFDDDFEAF